jgi:hypothetical protein
VRGMWGLPYFSGTVIVIVFALSSGPRQTLQISPLAR